MAAYGHCVIFDNIDITHFNNTLYFRHFRWYWFRRCLLMASITPASIVIDTPLPILPCHATNNSHFIAFSLTVDTIAGYIFCPLSHCTADCSITPQDAIELSLRCHYHNNRWYFFSLIFSPLLSFRQRLADYAIITLHCRHWQFWFADIAITLAFIYCIGWLFAFFNTPIAIRWLLTLIAIVFLLHIMPIATPLITPRSYFSFLRCLRFHAATSHFRWFTDYHDTITLQPMLLWLPADYFSQYACFTFFSVSLRHHTQSPQLHRYWLASFSICYIILHCFIIDYLPHAFSWWPPH